MKNIFYSIVIGLLLFNCTKKRTELILLGTVHEPVANFTPDSLYKILAEIKPDLILFEVDSSFFTKQFKFKKTWDSNENIATVEYMNRFDVAVRPYDFTGRNEYRKRIGSRPTDGLALQLLDSLYKKNMLDAPSEKIYQEFLEVNDTLTAFAYLGAKAFNSSLVDSIAQKRQHYQYNELLKIMEKHAVFANTYFVKNSNDSISYLEGYKKASEFWDLRNTAMAKNILHFAEEFRGSRIVVLNGFFHRYYLNSLIKEKQGELGFMVKEFYE